MAAHRCSSFAQEQLKKHGWKTGQGLGRAENGISEAIKVKLKHDTAGIGHNLGEQFTYRWWDDVFNRAANNIVVEKDGENGVHLTRRKNSDGLITNKKPVKSRHKKPLLYGSFVRSTACSAINPESSLKQDETSSACSSSSSSEEEEEEEDNIDEKFFKACGGRTAHKGARHGLNLSGKLKRIQAQEEGHSHRSSKRFEPEDGEETVKKRTHKHKRKKSAGKGCGDDQEVISRSVDALVDDDKAPVPLTKCRKHKKVDVIGCEEGLTVAQNLASNKEPKEPRVVAKNRRRHKRKKLKTKNNCEKP